MVYVPQLVLVGRMSRKKEVINTCRNTSSMGENVSAKIAHQGND
jgi:hypothetical protein